MSYIIITRHAAAVEWLRRQGIRGEVKTHVAEAAEICGRVVVGNLPLHLAAEAECVGSIEMPALTPEMRGRELSAEEMEAAGAQLKWYVVAAASSEESAVYQRGVLMHG